MKPAKRCFAVGPANKTGVEQLGENATRDTPGTGNAISIDLDERNRAATQRKFNGNPDPHQATANNSDPCVAHRYSCFLVELEQRNGVRQIPGHQKMCGAYCD
jgi:hypothetical protein